MTTILCNAVNANIDHYYEIKLKYNHGNVTLKSIQVKPVINEKYLELLKIEY